MSILETLKRVGKQVGEYQDKSHERFLVKQERQQQERSAYAQTLEIESKIAKIKAETRRHEHAHQPKPQNSPQHSINFFGSSHPSYGSVSDMMNSRSLEQRRRGRR